MSTVFEPDGRGPSSARLLLTGLCFLVVVGFVASVMIANSRGAFRKSIEITAVLADVGDGLPPKSDVKFQGVLVGLVTGVGPARQSGMNDVRIQLTPHYAAKIPRNVTARVVPSNVFAVPSVQLVYNGSAPAVTSGSHIAQDRSLATVRLQTSLDQLRRIVAAVGRQGTDTAVGMLATLAEATNGRGAGIEDAGARLRDIVTELNKVVSMNGLPSTLDSLSSALHELQIAAPELLDALHQSVLPMLTVAQQKQQLADLLSGGIHTTGTVGAALRHNTDRLIDITTHLSPALGALGDGAAHFPQMSVSITRLTQNFVGTFNPATQRITAKVVLQLTPNRQYTRADCPRYGSLAGPSCADGPTTGTPPGPPAAGLNPKNFQAPAALLNSDIGPVGSPAEQQQIAQILGGSPNAAADILFGPLARGATVSVAPDPSGGAK